MTSRFVRLLPALLAGAIVLFGARNQTALDRYVHAPDNTYKWEAVGTIPGQGVTTHVIDMTSQTWRTAAEVDKPVWRHWLLVAMPEKVTSTTAMLWIGGGSNRDRRPDKVDPFYGQLAALTGTVVAELRMVPNQPLVFTGDGKPRTEDALIAYAWDKYLRGGDDQWLPRMPMTKAAVRAMDTIIAFCGSEKGGNTKIEKFVVGGGSKRGWTTWTTAAVDSRVAAIIPAVIDMLNVEKSFTHHWRVYGFYAPAVKDYMDMGIMNWQGTPQYRALMKLVEPYEYRERFTMPKLILNSAGDQFFVPDSAQFYFDDLPGEKHLRYIPNTDHSLRESDARDSITSFYESVLTGKPRPHFTWKMNKDGSVRVKMAEKPQAVKLWQATNAEKRDFRLMTIGKAYQSTDLTESGSGEYVGRVAKPEKGWTAFFVELTFPGSGKYPLKLTTPVRVVPDVYPFPPPKHTPPVVTSGE